MAKLHSTVDRTNAALPAVICILSDLVIQGVLGGRFVPPEEIVIELTRLPAPGGVVAVLGNHDGWFDHDRVRQALEIIGIRVVEDTAIHLDRPACCGSQASATCGPVGMICPPHWRQSPTVARRFSC